MEFDNTYINHHHIHLLADRMSYNKKMVSVFRHGINKDDIGPIAKASFEETTEMFLQAAKFGELDEMRGVSANVMCGQEGYFGTSCFQTYIDNNKLFSQFKKYNKSSETIDVDDKTIDEIFNNYENEQSDFYGSCSIDNLKNSVISLNENIISNIIQEEDDDYNLDI